MKKKEIKFYKTFRELYAEQLRQNIESSLEQRWEKFWQLQKFHKQLFPENIKNDIPQNAKKRIIMVNRDGFRE